MYMCIKLRRRAAVLALALTAAFLLALFVPQEAGATPTEAGGTVRVPIIMYHSVTPDAKNACDYIIPESTFRADMEYLRRSGYTAVFMSDLAAWEAGTAELPEKPVVITLDDGYLNGLTVVEPVLEELGMKAVISVVGSYTQQYAENGDRCPDYAYLTWDDIRALSQSGCVEIGSHTYAMHSLSPRRGCAKMRGESTPRYRQVLENDLGRLQTELWDKAGVKPTVFAYPYGFYSADSLAVLKQLGFTAALGCEEKINSLDRSADELYHLGRFNRPAGISTADFMRRALQER